MTSLRLPAALLALATVLAASPGALAQQAAAPRATPDADALADAMRRLATSPRDVDALVTAGELSVRLGDLSGAASLFARADKVDPMNGRVKAGMGRVLVQEERPGAALRYFDQAVGYGLNPRAFAADRAFAYDLIGEQERAQRDYRVAMQTDSSDELIRRYALSLGISGRREEAFALLDPLLRKQDRSAWRARAFILAMGGDQAGADKIATSMMPGFASGLRPFFQKLPSLPAADRAFAVHFGEVRPTPDRLADARLVPALAPLAPESGVQMAAAAPVRTPGPVAAATQDSRATRQRDRRSGRERSPVQVAAAAPLATPRVVQTIQSPPAQVASAPMVTQSPVTQPPVTQAPVTPPATVPPAPTRAPAVASAPSVATPAASSGVASVTTGYSTVPRATSVVPGSTPAAPPALVAAAPVPPIVTGVAAATGPTATAGGGVSVASQPIQSQPVQSQPVQVATSAGVTVAPAPSAPAAAAPSAVTTTAAPPALAMVQAVPPEESPQRVAAATRPARLPRPPRSVNDSILARIVAGIEVPAAELASAPAAEPRTRAGRRATAAKAEAATPEVAAAPRTRAERRAAAAAAAKLDAETAASEVAAVPRTRAGRRAAAAAATKLDAETAAPEVAVVPRTRAGRRAAAAAAKLEAETAEAGAQDKPLDRAATRKAAAAKAAADRKAAEKKLADKAAADEKLAAKKAARSEPSRVWVQVAGGANESDLPKAWNAVKAKTPALAGKSAYSTPLRATNRVVTGPFKTEAEARAFVNTLAKQGVSAFPFTSEAGQKVTRLPGK